LKKSNHVESDLVKCSRPEQRHRALTAR